MKTTIGMIVSGLTLLMSLPVDANKVKVTWHEPAKYSDVKGANEHNKRFQKRVFNQLEKHIEKLAESLPDDMSLELTVTDVNLAGDVQYNFSMHQQIRLVKSIYWPKISFEYKLTDSGSLVKKGEVILKDMSFMDRGGMMRNSHDSLKYDKRLLTQWFKKELQQSLDNHQQQNNAVMSE